MRCRAKRTGCSAGRLATFLLAGLSALASAETASAISIELKDVAPDRIERQRAAVEGRLPLPRTPDVDRFKERMAVAGFKAGTPMLIRVFKEESELEVWLERGERFELFATYPICHWSGSLGPKLREGDKQTPEGFYTLTKRQLHHVGRWQRAINLGFPNAYDQAHKRDGSYILMHGGCSSVGCFAMTNPVMNEIYGLAKAAIQDGQRHLPVHVFPFRMTDRALNAHKSSPWHDYWMTLQAGYNSFERTRRPPRVSVCQRAYHVDDAPPKAAAAEQEAEADRKRGKKKSRQDMMLGAIRNFCPASVVVSAEGQSSAKR